MAAPVISFLKRSIYNYNADHGDPLSNPTEPGNAGQKQQQNFLVQQTQPQSTHGQPVAGQLLYGDLPIGLLVTPEHFKPYETSCPHCNAQITTVTEFFMGETAKTCVIAILSLVIWFGLFCVAFIPCCTNSLKDVRHICPHCHLVVAVYARSRIAPQYQSPWLRGRRSEVPTINSQGGYGQNQQEAKPGILIVQPRPPVTEQHFRSYPTTCQHCHSQITTETAFHVGDFVWTLFGLICFIWIPCCVNRCKDVKHTCPRCNKVVAEYLRHEKLY